jgi:hypothetical protein
VNGLLGAFPGCGFYCGNLNKLRRIGLLEAVKKEIFCIKVKPGMEWLRLSLFMFVSALFLKGNKNLCGNKNLSGVKRVYS